MLALGLFFQYFGICSLFGVIFLLIMCNKELKKRLPTKEEKEDMLKKGLITGKEKKLVLSEKTTAYRNEKKFKDELKKALLNQTKNQN